MIAITVNKIKTYTLAFFKDNVVRALKTLSGIIIRKYGTNYYYYYFGNTSFGFVLTSSLSSTCIGSGRANPTWASSVMRTRYSELLNLGALSFLSMSRMVKVVRTVADEGVRSSFSSVAYRRKYRGIEERRDKLGPSRSLKINK